MRPSEASRIRAVDAWAFALVELLVVVAIIAMLVGMLLPALGRARYQAQVTTCGARLQQQGQGVYAYAAERDGHIPRGPGSPGPYEPGKTWAEMSGMQIWIGGMRRFNGHGVLMNGYIADRDAMYCPGDDSGPGVAAQRASITEPTRDAFSSYIYRSLDQAPRGRVEDLGENDLGHDARALLFDGNLHGPFPPLLHTNHQDQDVNILYVDGHVERFANAGSVFSVKAQHMAGFPANVPRRADEILMNADAAEGGDLSALPFR